MTPSSTETPGVQNRPKRSALAAWLVLVPVIFITLACCGQLALLLPREYPAADTRSRLKAIYLGWPYSEILPVNIAAFIEDIQKERDRFSPTGWPAITDVEEGNLVGMPTSSTLVIAEISPVPTQYDRTPAVRPLTRTPTRPISTSTNAPRPSDTPTPPPTITASLTRTNTVPASWPPTSTDTEEPPPPSRTPTLTPTHTPTRTPDTPSPTPATPSPTHTPETPTVTPDDSGPTPTYAPVRPIAENNGVSEVDPDGRGCRAYFGYRNDNPVEVEIPYDPAGGRNYFSQPYVWIDPEPPPSRFLIERVSPAFLVIWDAPGTSFIWYLDGRTAEARWCDPPPR